MITIDATIAAAEFPLLHTIRQVGLISYPPQLRAFGQEAHVLVSSEQTGGAFCVLVFHSSGQRYAAAPSSRDR